jgi:hypothetical protein
MGVVYACALSFISKYLYQSCGPKPMTRVDINDNNQSSNKLYLKFRSVSQGDLSLIHVDEVTWMGSRIFGHGVHDIQGIVKSHLWVPL